MPPDGRRADDLRRGAPPRRLDAAALDAGADVIEIARTLWEAGCRAREDEPVVDRSRPAAAFQAGLRERLLASYTTPVVGPSPGAQPRASAPSRLAPLRGRPVVPSWWPRSQDPGATRRWAVLALVAVLVVAIAGSTAGRLAPAPIAARATIAEGATLDRAGAATPLTAGTGLQAGDGIRVGASGHAVIAMGGGETRLAGGAELRVETLSPAEVRIEVVAGRTYHRVVLPAGGRFVVTTGDLAWTALGTAFELDRDATATVGGPVTVLGLEHAVALDGDGLRAVVGEGQAARVLVAPGGASGLALRPIEPGELVDPWIVANAARDRSLGLGLAVPVGSAPASVAPSASQAGDHPASPSPAASDGPAGPTAAPPSGPVPTRRPSVRATDPAPPTPEATRPPPALPQLGLSATACPGGVVLDWSPARSGRFDHYRTVRATSPAILRAVPPGPGAGTVIGSVTRNRWATSADDTSIGDGSTAFYRTFALDAANRVLAASAVRSATGRVVAELGPLSVGPGDGSTTAFAWSAFDGPASCFSVEKLVYSTEDATPSALDGAPSLVVSTNRSLSEAVAELPSGSYHFRVQVLRRTAVGSPAAFVVAQTAVATYTVP